MFRGEVSDSSAFKESVWPAKEPLPIINDMATVRRDGVSGSLSSPCDRSEREGGDAASPHAWEVAVEMPRVGAGAKVLAPHAAQLGSVPGTTFGAPGLHQEQILSTLRLSTARFCSQSNSKESEVDVWASWRCG